MLKKYQTMKKCVLLLLVSLLFVGAAYAQKKEKKQKTLSETELKVAQAVSKKMLDENLVMYMSVLVSDYGRTALDGIKVTLIGDKFTCNLPYQGSSRINTYGSQSVNVTANDAPVKVESIYNEKKGYYKLNFAFESDYDSERFTATLKVFLSGKVNLELSSSRRGSANYQGGLFIEM